MANLQLLRAAPFKRPEDRTIKNFVCGERYRTVAGNVLISDKQSATFSRGPSAPPVSPRCAGFCRSVDDLLPVIIACRSTGENIKLSTNTDASLLFATPKNMSTDAFRLKVLPVSVSELFEGTSNCGFDPTCFLFFSFRGCIPQCRI